VTVIIHRFKEKSGRDAWFCKADNIKDLMPDYIDVFPHSDPEINAALGNLKLAKMRVNDAGPNKAAGREVENKKKKTTTFYPTMILYKHIDLPLETFDVAEDEIAYIKNMCAPFR
jgi:hypothetical protein